MTKLSDYSKRRIVFFSSNGYSNVEIHVSFLGKESKSQESR